ncbi:ABC transporter substrate-binding protein [Rhodobacteraceae bacterium KMM 6894]|nr:ABC transporter substrate-binding protein [Rhodobacteraceae bacterium KMM 6894]
MTLKTLASAAAMAAMMAAPVAAQSVPESDETIKIMTGDWTSISLQGEMMSLILQTVGYNTELVVADDSGRYPGFENGDLHIAMETWQTTQMQNLEKSVATGKVLDMGGTGLEGVEDWWYPMYMKDRCPGLPAWEALKDCAEVFSTADTAPKGRYVGGPVSWGDHDERLIAALDLPFEVVHPGTDAAMFAELRSAYDREAPIVLWVWKPHWVPSVFEGEYVQFPKFEEACFTDPAWGPNPDATYDCGKPYGWIKKMAWAGGEEVWPCAYEIVRNYEMDNETIADLLVEIDLNGRPSTEVATEWLQANADTWQKWASCAM